MRREGRGEQRNPSFRGEQQEKIHIGIAQGATKESKDEHSVALRQLTSNPAALRVTNLLFVVVFFIVMRTVGRSVKDRSGAQNFSL